MRLLDDVLEGFLEEQGLTIRQFYTICSRIADRGDSAEWSSSAAFVARLLAFADFDSFVNFMEVEARKRMRKERSEAKFSGK